MPSSNSTCVSPRSSGPATHRRRANDFFSASEDEVDGGSGALHHRKTPAGECLFMPESWVWRMEDYVLGLTKFVNSWKSRKNTGRRIMGTLMVMMMVFMMFLKIFYNDVEMINGGKNNRRRLDGVFTMQTWANHHQSVVSSEEIKSSFVSSMPTRVLEKYPVSVAYEYIHVCVCFLLCSFLAFGSVDRSNGNVVFVFLSIFSG